MGMSWLLGGCATLKDYQVARTVEQDPGIPHLALNGAVFHSETFGDSQDPVVIVVHGGLGWDYRSLLPFKALSDEFFVVFYDQRGTGLSPRVGVEQLSLDSSLTDLDAKDGKMRVSLVEGVEAFRGEVLFLTSACDVILGVEFQQEQMQYFRNARMVVINDK